MHSIEKVAAPLAITPAHRKREATYRALDGVIDRHWTTSADLDRVEEIHF